MAPPQESGASFRQVAVYATEPKRMRLSATARSTAAGSSTTTRASTGAPTAMTNKGSVYKAQRGRAVTAAAVKAKAPTTHRRRGRKGKSVYRGVCVTREGKWRAVIYKERKQLYLGVYESEVDAAKAHDRAARFHFAENAVCNFDSEHEADRQAVIHKQRQLLQQQQLAEDREHAQLHGGSFSVGREEFDDLDEYHRGMDEACSSEEDERDVEADSEEGGDGYEGEACSRSSRSLSSGSMSDDCSNQASPPTSREVAAAAAAAAAAFEPAFYARASAPAVLPSAAAASAVPGRGCGGISVGHVSAQQQQERGSCCSSGGSMSSSGESDSDFTGVTTTALLRDVAQPSAQEGMGFPYAEDLLGYEMQSWYCCQDEDSRNPAVSTGGTPFDSLHQQQPQQQQQQQPFLGTQQHSEELWGTSVGANLGWGFGDFALAYPDCGSRSSSGSMSSSGPSCDDDYVPSALPPLMGICGEP